MQRPYIQFYTSDYLNDLNLRRCHPAAQGIWIRVICIMSQGVPFGHLRAEPLHTAKGKHGTPPPGTPRGTPPPPPTSATPGGLLHDLVNVPRNGSLEGALYLILGMPKPLVEWAIQHLEQRDVFSRTSDGIIFCRRMVRDEQRHRDKVERARKAFEKRARKQQSDRKRTQKNGTTDADGEQGPPPRGTPHGTPQGPPPRGIPPGTPQAKAGTPTTSPPQNQNQIYKEEPPPTPPPAGAGRGASRPAHTHDPSRKTACPGCS